ncbi:hypothetical protein AALA54_11365 [Oscillospiraceae bacterium 44-34]
MMNRTQNYNLCQWEAADKVQRTDFNADNAKMDTALGGIADRVAALEAKQPVELRRIKLTGATKRITLSLSGIDVTQYDHLRLEFRDMELSLGYLGAQVNGLTSGYVRMNTNGMSPSASEYASVGFQGNGRGSLEIHPLNGWVALRGEAVSAYPNSTKTPPYNISASLSWSIHKDVSYTGLTKLELISTTADATLAAGGEVVLYGMPK